MFGPLDVFTLFAGAYCLSSFWEPLKETVLGFPGGSEVKNLPAMQETRAWCLGWEDPLEMEMATHSSILAWEIPWTEEPGGLYSPWGHRRVGQDLTITTKEAKVLPSIH